MSLVIRHGLDGYSGSESGRDDVDIRTGMLLALVERGFSNLLREVVWVNVGDVEGARIFEVARVGGEVMGRWLPEKDAAPLLAHLANEYEAFGTHVSFAYGGDIDEQGGIDAADLNIVADGSTKLPAHFELKDSRPLKVWPLEACWLGDSDDERVEAAWTFHGLAKEMRLVLAVA